MHFVYQTADYSLSPTEPFTTECFGRNYFCQGSRGTHQGSNPAQQANQSGVSETHWKTTGWILLHSEIFLPPNKLN